MHRSVKPPCSQLNAAKKRKTWGIAPQLIEDILRRLMRESYLNEKDVGFKR